jgi:formylmethanofuran--tetrahydromethanopterin N-formyltransferase
MRIGPTEILDTHAEAFAASYTRLLISAIDDFWRDTAVNVVAGYGTSVIGCDAEVGLERVLANDESPDGRPAASVLLFAFTTRKLARAVGNRVGQCVLTCPTAACYNGLPEKHTSIPLGDYVRFYGDGFEHREGGSLWHIPVMDGEFVVESTAGVGQGVAGGNIIVQAESLTLGLAAAQRASRSVAAVPGVIAPFPGGICRSGSKVGSKYKKLVASTHEAFCPTLGSRIESKLVPGAACAYEIVINGVDRASVDDAMRAAINEAAGDGVLAIGAGNFGGKLGKITIPLRELFANG